MPLLWHMYIVNVVVVIDPIVTWMGNFGFQSVVVVPSPSKPTRRQLRSTLISAALAARDDDGGGKKDFGSRKAVATVLQSYL